MFGSDVLDKLFKLFPLFNYYIAAITIFYILILFCRAKNYKTKITVLYALCILNFIFYVIDSYYAYTRSNRLLTILPLQLCYIAVFLIPLSLLLKKELIFDFVFYICAPGALIALLFPNIEYTANPYSLMTISFFIFHFCITAIPFLFTVWGMYKPSPTIKKAFRLSIVILILTGLIHVINLILGQIFHINTNYFFTIIKYSATNNIAFKQLSKIISYDFFYLLPGLIFMYIYMLTIYFLTKPKMTAKNKISA
ncbi:MAG: YwaF family protein [Bacillota bacterium]|nr:YwaF family protein [Bacillota bacterium]